MDLDLHLEFGQVFRSLAGRFLGGPRTVMVLSVNEVPPARTRIVWTLDLGTGLVDTYVSYFFLADFVRID